MEKRNIEYLLVYPDISCKEEYIQRYISRGNHIDFIKHLDKNFDVRIFGGEDLIIKGYDEDAQMFYYKLYFQKER
mgnify:CR=1 FL=1